jgi:hypothetical protein
MIWLTLLSALAALLFLAVVATALVRIVGVLEEIGGTGTSYLAKLRLGLRAIERETSHLPSAAPEVNKELEQIAQGLAAVDTALGNLHGALERQEAA